MIQDRNKYPSEEEASLASWTLSSPQFPIRLHDMLDEAEANGYQHIVSWLPEGNGFQIHDPEAMLPILQKRGFNQSKWKSFLRQLQNYGFRREIRGPHKGTCTHDLFVRGHRDLCLAMRRIKRTMSGDNLVSGKKTRSREDLDRVTSANSSFSSLNSSFSTQLSARSAASFTRDGLGSRPSLSNLAISSRNISSRNNQGGTNRNATFEFSPSSNPLLFSQSSNGHTASNGGTSRNLLAAAGTDTHQLIWEIQNELAKLNTGSSIVQKQTVQPQHPTSNITDITEDFEPLDFRAKPTVNDTFSSLVEGIRVDVSTERMCNIFLNEPTLEETYDLK